jgi:hypothetical protein
MDAENAPTGLCKTADGFARLPHASSSCPVRSTTKTRTPRIIDQRPTDSAKEAIIDAALSR